MKTIIFDICNHFDVIRLLFAGRYESRNRLLRSIQREMYDIDIPTNHQDRVNLRSDNTKVIRDYKKAYVERKHELVPDGKA